MKNTIGRFGKWIATITVSVVLGCGGSPAPTEVDETAATHGHSHSDERDHSVLGHGHPPGPRGGTIVDWGGGTYHIELLVDHDKQEATAYVLGSDERTPTPIMTDEIILSIQDPEMQIALQPVPLENETEGISSRFVGTDERLGVVREYAGTISGVVDQTPYAGNFDEAGHAH